MPSAVRVGGRPMFEEYGGYDPIEYHDGTVPSHDDSLVSRGLYRYC